MNMLSPDAFSPDQAARRKKHRFWLDLMLGCLIIALLIGASVDQMSVAVWKAQMASLMTTSNTERYDVIEDRAVTGDWPDNDVPGETPLLSGNDGKKMATAQLDHIRQGAIHMLMYNRRNAAGPVEMWSIRPAVAEDDAPTVLWLCGSRAVPAGLHVFGEDLTTIPPEENYRFCR